MAVYDVGGGGGRSSNRGENDECALAKPIELTWPLSPNSLQSLNEMFDSQAKCAVRIANRVTTLEEAPATAVDVLLATVSLTSAQIGSLGTTAVQLVAAPGSGLILIPSILTVEQNTSVVWGGSGTWRTRYDTAAWSGGFDLHSSMSVTLNALRTELFIRPPASSSFTAGYATRDPRNKAIVIQADADPTLSGTSTATVNLMYYVVTAL